MPITNTLVAGRPRPARRVAEDVRRHRPTTSWLVIPALVDNYDLGPAAP